MITILARVLALTEMRFFFLMFNPQNDLVTYYN